MKIQMLTTKRGTADGHNVQQYYVGLVYNVPESLGRSFLSTNDARTVDQDIDEGLHTYLGKIQVSHPGLFARTIAYLTEGLI